MDKVEVRVEEAGWILQLRVMADMFVQDGQCRPLDQLPAGGDISVNLLKRKSVMCDIGGGGGGAPTGTVE